MHEIINVPSSVRENMERAMSLVHQEKPVKASIFVGAALTELAKSEPDLFGALVAAKLGVKQMVVETRERIPVERRPIRSDDDMVLELFCPEPRYTERVTTKIIRIW